MINSANWFRNADLWHRVSYGYNNPLNYGRVHSELVLLLEIEKELGNYITERPIVFLGIGTGDTEMQIIDMQLKRYSVATILGIDINIDFLGLFENSIKMKMKENKDIIISYFAINKLFEQIEQEDFLQLENQRIFCTLGNTIGNFNRTSDFFSILNRCTITGDLLLLGYQLDDNIKVLFEKYSSNPYFTDFILNDILSIKMNKVKWNLDYENSTIEAWIDSLQIFRSKKFKNQEIISLSNTFGFESLNFWNDNNNNMCIHLMKKEI